MSPIARRVATVVGMTVLGAAAASAGVLLWRHLDPPPVQLAVAPAAPPASESAGAELAVGDRRPEFTLADVDGQPRSVSEWDGKLLFVNFWATWCPPCLEEIPVFVRLQDELGGQGVQFLGVALDSPENVRRFMDDHGMNYPSLHGASDAIALSRRYGNSIGALPYTVVVAPSGTVVATHHGILDEAQARELVQAHR